MMICKLFYSPNQIRTTPLKKFRFDLTNDLMMYRLAVLSSYPGNPPACLSITAMESIECSLQFLGSFKSSSTQNCFCPGSFFETVPSPARAHSAQLPIPIWAAVAEIFPIWGAELWGRGALTRKDRVA